MNTNKLLYVNNEEIKKEIIRLTDILRAASTKEAKQKIYKEFQLKKLLTKDYKILQYEDMLYSHLAKPEEVNINKLYPVIEVVNTKSDRLLFKYLSYYWSFPVSEGIGRRIKLIVRDEYNGKVIGIIGLKDPIIGLRVRDNYIGWKQEKNEYLSHIFDAHILGAVEPYSKLLAGKLVASILQSEEIKNIVESKYNFKHDFSVILYTTTTLYGKSLMLKDTPFQFLGYTKGWSAFHIMSFKEYFKNYSNQQWYKCGLCANKSMKFVRVALKTLGLRYDIFEIGHKRGFYLLPLSSDFKEVLCGKTMPKYDLLKKVDDITNYIKEHFMRPRSNRVRLNNPKRVSEMLLR